MNVTDILEDSPNGYRVTSEAPKNVDEAIRYYLQALAKFNIDDYPVEHAMANYGMGKLLFGDMSRPKVSEERAKRIENALYHLNQSLPVFNSHDYPTMYGLISIMMAALFRERAALISNRSFLADRSSPEDSVMYGVDQIQEAFPVFFRSKTYLVEHAICSLEAGWLYVLQSEFIDNFRDDSIREQAATYLERAISLSQAVKARDEKQLFTFPGAKEKLWNPTKSAPADYPEHIRLLLEGHSFAYVEGSALYLLGRLYEGWTELNVIDTNSKGPNSSSTNKANQANAEAFELQNQLKAFEYFSQSLRPKYLPKDSFLWADAHHRLAVTVIKYPKVVNPDYSEHQQDSSDIHLEVALNHLNLALRCPALSSPAAMDLHFHLAQTAISRLQLIIDRVPMGQSVTKTLAAHSEGLDLIKTVETHLEEARKRTTPASTQTTQDGYLYFFSCLKISEFCMLEAACRPELQPVEKEDFLTDAVEHLIDALKARSLTDNADLHYVATVQMSQLLLAVKRTYAAAKSYAKSLLVLSLLINRSLFNPEDVQAKLSEEIVRQVGQSLAAGARDVPWIKLHYGPISLNERLTAGYASWSFEDAPSLKIRNDSASVFDLSGASDSHIKDVYKDREKAGSVNKYQPDTAASHTPGDEHKSLVSSTAPIYRASPPKGVPPLKLPNTDHKKVYISSEVTEDLHLKPAELDASPGVMNKKKPPPPAGVIPLFALGHNPHYDPKAALKRTDSSVQNAVHNYYLGPYGRRMRRRIPPTKEMFDIDQHNLKTFGYRNGKAVFLLPNHIRRVQQGKKLKKFDETKQKSVKVDKNKWLREKIGVVGQSQLSEGANGATMNKEHDEREESEEEEEEESEADEENEENEENEGHEDNEEGNEEEQGMTRGRRKSIRPPRGPPPPLDVLEIPHHNQVHKKKGMLGWLFGKKAPHVADSASAGRPQSAGGFSLFGMFKKKEVTVEADDSLEMWSSPQCFYTFNILSRQSRMQLVLRGSKLEVLDGERANYMLFNAKPKYLSTYYALKKLLTKDCAKLVVPPVSLKDLSQRPFLEVQALFNSQVKICRKLDDLEHLLYNKISKYDNFLPFVTCAPVFTRDLNGFDDSLLNAEQLILNINNEDILDKHNARKKISGGEGKASENKAGIAAGGAGAGDDKKSQFAYDSVSSAHPSSVGVSSTTNSRAQVTKQRAEEAEAVAVGKVTLSLSQCLDGANYLYNGQQGSRDMLESYLCDDECLMVWHLPVVPSQPLQVVLIWRDHSASLHKDFSSSSPKSLDELLPESQKAKNKHKQKAKNNPDGAPAGSEPHKKGIVMEIAKSDLDTSHILQYLQGFLDALHSRSAPVRATASTDALRALSCALSFTEFLHMIPPHVTSLIICCPSPLRLVPWHLLLIEQANNSPFTENTSGEGNTSPASPLPRKPTEIHLMEKFAVRLGPTLALFELNACGGAALRHSVGLHRLCAVDGEADGPDRSCAGIRGTDLEVACVSNVWSADPGDYRVLSNDSAVPRALQTVTFGDGDDEEYRKFKQDIYIQRREKLNHIRVVANEKNDADFVAKLKAKHDASRKDPLNAGEREGEGEGEGKSAEKDKKDKNAGAETGSEHSGGSSEEEDEESENEGTGKKKKRRKLTASAQDKKALTMCRVLHISALKVPLDDVFNATAPRNTETESLHSTVKEGTKKFSRIALPRYDKLETFKDPHYKKKLQRHNREQREDDARHTLSAKEIIQQVFVKNCALCVLSRFAFIDDLKDIRSPQGWNLCDINCEFIEAMHLAGAKTVLHPLWDGSASGLAALAHLIFLVRFYSILPTNSRSRLSIVETCRQTQLWLRDASADAIIAFVHKAPVPKAARKMIIEEMEAFVSASLTPAQQKQKLEAQRRAEEAANLAAPSKFISPDKLASPNVSMAGASHSVVRTNENGETEGNRIGGTTKFFNHFLHWGAFTISGTGAAVHHPNLTENKDEDYKTGHIAWDDKELNNMAFEASMLRAEGKISEAKDLEALIREIRLDRIKRGLAAAKATGARAGRGFLDTLDFLDKKLLDQDSDGISVSDDSEEERQKRKLKKQNKARESDSDEYDDDEVEEDELVDGKFRPKLGTTPNAKDVTTPRGAGAGAGKNHTPSKKFVPRALELGSMKPEDVAYEKWKSKVGGLNMIVRDPVLPPRKATKAVGDENYEYNMMKQVKEGGLPEESQEDYEARMEALYQKKDRTKGKRLKKAAQAGEESSGEDDEGDEDAQARRALKKKQMRHAHEDSESDYEASEDEEEDGDDSDSDQGLYAQRKQLRKKKELKKKGKHKKMTRFQMAMKEVRGGVRSYSSVVKTITDKVPERVNAKELLRVSHKPKAKEGQSGDNPYEENQDEKCIIS